jgi:nucleotide-binding universal stress UspA family protein
MPRMRRILHATDFSPASRPAFRRALEMARTGRGELIILHVNVPTAIADPGGYVSWEMYEQVDRAVEASARRKMARLVERARGSKVRCRGILLRGVADVEIVRAARRQRADVLVLGTHGRTGLRRLFLGSVASRVIASAPCPVLTVRAR